MHPVSGYIIFRNAPLISLAVESILPFVDDLLLLDRNDEPACFPQKQHPAVRVEHQRQSGGYFGDDWEETKWRNYCLDACKHDWVISLDADEILDDFPPNYFRSKDHSLVFQTLNLASLNTYIKENHSCECPGWWPDWHVRYWNRKFYRYNNALMHCNLVDSDGKNAVMDTFAKNPSQVEQCANAPAIWHLHIYCRVDRKAFVLNRPDLLTLKPITRRKPKLLEKI